MTTWSQSRPSKDYLSSGCALGRLNSRHGVALQGKLNNPRDEDIRSKILRHEDPKDKSASLFSRAYAKTQPNRIYAEPEEEEEADKEKKG